VFEALAMNDVVVSRGAASGMVELRVEVDGTSWPTARRRPDHRHAHRLHGLRAVGRRPHAAPLHAGWVLVPIAPHTLSNRPIVLADPGEIAIEIVAARDASASFDMQSLTSLHRGDRIIVRRSSTARASCTRGLELLRHPAREAALEQGST
jgi:NAD+ kinase